MAVCKDTNDAGVSINYMTANMLAATPAIAQATTLLVFRVVPADFVEELQVAAAAVLSAPPVTVTSYLW